MRLRGTAPSLGLLHATGCYVPLATDSHHLTLGHLIASATDLA